MWSKLWLGLGLCILGAGLSVAFFSLLSGCLLMFVGVCILVSWGYQERAAKFDEQMFISIPRPDPLPIQADAPVERPEIFIERWAEAPEQPMAGWQRGFHLKNCGKSAATGVTLDHFSLRLPVPREQDGSDASPEQFFVVDIWQANDVPVVESNATRFMLVYRMIGGPLDRFSLDEFLKQAFPREKYDGMRQNIPMIVRYKDSTGKKYKTIQDLYFAPNLGVIVGFGTPEFMDDEN
jgi:hypothetical protein